MKAIVRLSLSNTLSATHACRTASQSQRTPGRSSPSVGGGKIQTKRSEQRALATKHGEGGRAPRVLTFVATLSGTSCGGSGAGGASAGRECPSGAPARTPRTALPPRPPAFFIRSASTSISSTSSRCAASAAATGSRSGSSASSTAQASAAKGCAAHVWRLGLPAAGRATLQRRRRPPRSHGGRSGPSPSARSPTKLAPPGWRRPGGRKGTRRPRAPAPAENPRRERRRSALLRFPEVCRHHAAPPSLWTRRRQARRRRRGA